MRISRVEQADAEALGEDHGRTFLAMPAFHVQVHHRGYPMTTQPMKIPGPDHPITIERNLARVVVSVADRVIADSQSALTLREATLPAVQYIPRKDVNMTLLERSQHASHCPYKGDAAYYSIPTGSERSVNAVWSYESPFPAVAAIKDHLAFYPHRVDAIEEHHLPE
jgi:uncharacterized protein (DUF427 family)